MLVLTRKPGESLRIGGEVRITVVSAANGQVRIAIDAPDEVAIHREEVLERIASANQAAAEASVEALDRLARSDTRSDHRMADGAGGVK